MQDQIYDVRSGLRHHLMMVLPVNDRDWFWSTANLAAVADPTEITPASFNNWSMPGYQPVGARLHIAAGNQGTLASCTIDFVGVDAWGIRVEDSIELRTDQQDRFNGCVQFTRFSFARVDRIRIKSITAAANDELHIGFPLPMHFPFTAPNLPTLNYSAPGLGRNHVFQFPHGGEWTFIDHMARAELILDTTNANALHVADGDRLIVTDEQKTVRWEITAGAAAAGYEKLDLTAWVTARDARTDIIAAVQSHHADWCQLLTVGASGHAITVDDKAGKTKTFMLGTAASEEYIAVTIGGSAAATATNLGAAITAAVAAGHLGAHISAKVVGDTVRVFSNRYDLKDSFGISIYANDEDVAAPLTPAPSFAITRPRWGVTPIIKEGIARQWTANATADRAAIWFVGGTQKTFVELVREAAGVWSIIKTGGAGTAIAVDFTPKRAIDFDPLFYLVLNSQIPQRHGDAFWLQEGALEDDFEFDDTVQATFCTPGNEIDIATAAPTPATVASRTATAINGGSGNTTWKAAYDDSVYAAAGGDRVLLLNAPAIATVLIPESNCAIQYGDPTMAGYAIRAPHWYSLALNFEIQGFGAHSLGVNSIPGSFQYAIWDLWRMAAAPQPGLKFIGDAGAYSLGSPRAMVWDNSGVGETALVTGGLSGLFIMQTVRTPEETRRTHHNPFGVSKFGKNRIIEAEAQMLGNRMGGAGTMDRKFIGAGRKVKR